MNSQKRRQIFEILKQTIPKPETELNYKSNYELLVAVVLSAQATDVSVNLATDKLYKVADTPEKMLKLGVARLKKYIKNIGLYNSKAENVIKLSQQLINLHDGNVPDNRESLEALPGVGRKTANVVLNTAFGQPTIAVDTHIFRVSNRTKIAPGKNVIEVEQRLQKFVADEYKLNAHHWLILHGRYTCKARKPLCGDCAINTLCEYSAKNL